MKPLSASGTPARHDLAKRDSYTLSRTRLELEAMIESRGLAAIIADLAHITGIQAYNAVEAKNAKLADRWSWLSYQLSDFVDKCVGMR